MGGLHADQANRGIRESLSLGLAEQWLSDSASAKDLSLSKTYQLSYELEALRKSSAAVDALAGIASKQRKDYFYHARMGWLYYLARSSHKSIKSYRRAARLKPRAIEPHLGMLLPQIALRRWRDAQATARKVLRMEPKNITARTNLAWVLFNLGRFSEAERVYLQEVEGLFYNTAGEVTSFKLREVATALQQVVSGAWCSATALGDLVDNIFGGGHTEQFGRAGEDGGDLFIAIELKSERAAGEA